MSLGSLTQLLTKANESVVVLGNQNVLHCQYENQITTISKTKIDQEFCRVKCYDRRYRTGASWKKQKGKKKMWWMRHPDLRVNRNFLRHLKLLVHQLRNRPVHLKYLWESRKKRSDRDHSLFWFRFRDELQSSSFLLIFWKVCQKVKNPWEVAYAKRNWSGWKKMKRLLCGNPYGEYRTKNTENSNRTTYEKRRRRRQRRRAQKGGKLDIQN